MAKQNKQTARSPQTKKPSESGTRKIKHEILGVTFLFLGAFSLLALISYQHSDPSIFTQTSRMPRNYGGKIGAQLAEVLVQFAGLSAFVFSALCLAFARKLFQGETFSKLLGNFFWILLAILSASTFSSLQITQLEFGGAKIPAGGVFGGWIAHSLKLYLNFWGATLFTFAVFLISLVFCTPFSAATFFKYVSGIAILACTFLAKVFAKTFNIVREAPILQKKMAEMKLERALPEKIIKPPSTVEFSPSASATIADFDADENLDIDADIISEISIDELRESVGGGANKGLKVFERKKESKRAPKQIAAAIVGNYTLPPLEFLSEPLTIESHLDKAKLQENSRVLEQKLTSFGIEGQVVAVRPGPVITMYEFKPGAGVKISQIQNLADDLSLALSAQSVRIIAPIPGKNVVGIEIPNEEREKVYLREILGAEEFHATKHTIPLAIGKDISGVPMLSDLGKMPHLLIAGAPGAGKSVFINSLICSLLYKFSPKDMRLIMVDPKQLELNLYENIPHLLLPIVDDPKKASNALKWAVNEMERRYRVMARSSVRHISQFNEKLDRDGAQKMSDLLCPKDEAGMPKKESLAHLFQHNEKGEPNIERLPYILIIIDEFADLMMAAKNDVETNVVRIAQKARAAGIHLVIATQRPSVDVVSGLVKSNLPSRISFKVPTKTDSRTILDSNGAEKLLGQGDLLFIPPGNSVLSRMHGAFVTEEEIMKICDHWRAQGAPIYQEDILIDEEEKDQDEPDGAGDDLYQEAITFIREQGQASASMIQRRFKVGYNRAARMIDAMEMQGVVGPSEGAKPREVLYR